MFTEEVTQKEMEWAQQLARLQNEWNLKEQTLHSKLMAQTESDTQTKGEFMHQIQDLKGALLQRDNQIDALHRDIAHLKHEVKVAT